VFLFGSFETRFDQLNLWLGCFDAKTSRLALMVGR